MVLLLLILFLLLRNQQKLRTLGVFVFVSVESSCSGMISAITNNKYLLKRALSIFKKLLRGVGKKCSVGCTLLQHH